MGNCKASCPDKINAGEEDEMAIIGYCRSFPKLLLTYFLGLISCGILLLITSWKRSIMLKLTHTQCPLEHAEKVLLVDSYNQEFVETVIRPRDDVLVRQQHIYFCNKKIKYIWKDGTLEYVKVSGLEVDSCSVFYALSGGLNTTEAVFRLQLYGENSIFVELKPVIKLILSEIGSPFYIYQMFIVIVWLIQLYYQFALCIVLLSVISVAATVWETRKQSKALKDAVESHATVTVLRDGKETLKSSHELVPGDVLILSQGNFTLECDAVLISGSCVVNESMLTGESVPITKVPITSDGTKEYSTTSHKRSTLFCGTQVLHTISLDEFPVKAVVYRTGFSTAKGELVRAILFPKPFDFKLYNELFKSMVIFFIIGIPAMVYAGVIWYHLDAYTKEIVLTVMDVSTFLVPPVLPAVLTSINNHAQRRLRQHGIYCLNTRYINISGSLDVVCFDKTGTITEDSLDLMGVVPIHESFQPLVRDLSKLTDSLLITAMATCHSLTKVDNHLIGYTLDMKMFEASGWELEEAGSSNSYFERVPLRIVYHGKKHSRLIKEPVLPMAIVREFPFESLLQRMSVVTMSAGNNNFEVFLKGAPEMVSLLCEEQTVPENFKEVLESYTRQGFRVLAVGWKVLPPEVRWNDVLQMKREDLEIGLHFQGFLILQNSLKAESYNALTILKEANIRSVMATGDNLLTAITVARECGMVEECDSIISVEAEIIPACNINHNTGKLKVHYSYAKLPGLSDKLTAGQNGIVEDMYMPVMYKGRYHLALEGKTFVLIRNYDPQLLLKVVQKGTVFARMLPEQKLYLIESLQQLGYQVGMCGDGANDCGALKTAHAGVSLSLAEASVASPFTSKKQNIQCIPTVIREGRATLVATFGAFQYMVCYCFVLLGAVLILFWDGQKPSDGAYVLIDIILNLLPPILFGGTAAYHGLVKRPPTLSILSFLPQFSMCSFICSQIGLLLIIRYYCMIQPWYEPFIFDKNRIHHAAPSHLATAIISVNTMSYVIAAIIFSPGPPYRSSIYSNKIYIAVVVVQFLLVTFLTIYPADFLSHYLNFKMAPYLDYHLKLYCISLGNFIFCYIWETFFIRGILFEYVVPTIHRWRGVRRRFEKLEQELQASNWPPICKYETSDSDKKGETLSFDDSTETSILHHSKKHRWSWQSSEIRHSLFVGLKLSRGSNWKSSRSEPTTFATFHDGTHQMFGGNTSKETQAQDFV